MSALDSVVPWELLIRKTLTPAAIMDRIVSSAADPGPSVATILVRLNLRSLTIIFLRARESVVDRLEPSRRSLA